MFFILLDILLLVVRTLIAVGINRLKIRRKTLVKFNIINMKDIQTDRVTSAFSDSQRKGFIEDLERSMIADQESHLKILADVKGIGFVKNSEPYSLNADSNTKLVDFVKEEGENFVIGEAAGLALRVGTTVSAGAAGAIGEGIILGKDAVIDEYSKAKEETQEAKEEYVRNQNGDILMISSSAKERIYHEAVALIKVREQELVDEINREIDSHSVVAGSPKWKAEKAKLDFRINTSKVLLKIVDASFVVLTTILSIMAMFMLIVSLIVGGVAGYVAIDSREAPKEQANNNSQNIGTSNNNTNKDNNADEAPKGNGDAPSGIDPKSWATASVWGQKIAEKAHDSAIMKVNGKHLEYQQGNTPVGVYDCSVFVTAVYESFGMLTTGKKRTKGANYDFNTNKKSDLQAYMATSAMRAFYPRHPEMKVATLFQGDWESKIQPGDMLLVSGHVAIYIGKNTKGTHMMAHAASPSAYTYYDANMTKSGREVGLAPITNLKTRSGATTIYRPHVDFK